MKRLLWVLVAAFALAVGTSAALANGGSDGNGCPTACSGNTSDQSASLDQSGSSAAVAQNSGNASETEAVAVSANKAGISQFAGQATTGGTNDSTQSADVSQGASATAVAMNEGNYADTEAKAKAENEAFVSQAAFQLSMWGTANSSSQSVWGSQEANALALAQNSGWCAETEAFGGSFNHGWIGQLAFQLASPGYFAVWD